MTFARWKFPVVFAACLLFVSSLCAQELDLVGRTGWQTFGRGIRIYAERVENNRTTGFSGSLRLQIWATDQPYDGVSDLNGFVLGTYNLRPLEAGFHYANLSRIVRFNRPPPGLYYTTITLEENTVDGFVIADSENFTEPASTGGLVNFGTFGQGSATVESNNDVGFVGNVSWLAGNHRVQLFAEQILNARASGRSGVLRVRLWATSTPYSGEPTLQGYPMATKRIGRVAAGSYIPNFSRYTFFWPPPPGNYYVTMTLEEFVPGGWNIVDYITFDGTSLF